MVQSMVLETSCIQGIFLCFFSFCMVHNKVFDKIILHKIFPWDIIINVAYFVSLDSALPEIPPPPLRHPCSPPKHC